jgi:superfamily II DNA or RNA helicase
VTRPAVKSLAASIARYVGAEVQARGRQYQLDRRVVILDGDDELVRATVQGTNPYNVTLSYEVGPRELEVDCSCPYFQDRREPCKHIWATVLAADDRGLLADAAAGHGPRVVPQDAERGDWNELDDDDDWPPDTGRPLVLPEAVTRTLAGRHGRRAGARKGKGPVSWTEQVGQVRHDMEREAARRGAAWPAGREVSYVADAQATGLQGSLVIDVACRERKKDGQWGKLRSRQLMRHALDTLPESDDRTVLTLLLGSDGDPGGTHSGYRSYDAMPNRFQLPAATQPTLMPMMCRTGRCLLRLKPGAGEPQPVRWDDGGPWELWLEIIEAPGQYKVKGCLRRGEQRMALDEPGLLTAGGILICDGRAAPFDDGGAFAWVSLLREHGTVNVPADTGSQLLEAILSMPRAPKLALPASLHFEEVVAKPTPRVVVKRPTGRWGWAGRLPAELSFDYQGAVVAPIDPGRGVYRADARRFLLRDAAAEEAAAAQLREAGFTDPSANCDAAANELSVTPKRLPGAVRSLTEAGWHVEAQGKLYRRAGAFRVEVSSDVDWFELHGKMEFDDQVAGLPRLLRAVKHGDGLVRLDDGTCGILPEQWLHQCARLAELGEAKEDHLRFEKAQVGLLDALLEALPDAHSDTQFEKARNELRRFDGVRPAKAPRTFKGTLRPYQREGLGWLGFLRRFEFGGCLADDMGLGKTVQVLALLESRRTRRGTGRRPPSLVVVPRSLVFNWMQEAARFTPRLRVLDHTGPQRAKAVEYCLDYDVVVTTYGTLRRDVEFLRHARFDYVVLDEAQAIKNAATQAAKAARLLRADHRLALSGTPIENHLGELWSLFEFLNPGMLGRNAQWYGGAAGGGARHVDGETRHLLARGLRPFILRRTKEQVAADLPEKVEQTIHCDLLERERSCYNELRRHYRQSLLKLVDRDGIGRSKIHVLEALLRLRQAACHLGLVDKTLTAEPSAKLELLISQLLEVMDGGHKALVFSQFTSLLAIVRQHLDGAGVTYEYLDGSTHKRAERVQRFQTDPECQLFLISIKAGGLGLNLTAADYVFLLDPWWNPAVEAQAVDRTHRIGQTRRVFAYRLIARDTVEEKVLELQQSKRDLADAIITADNSLIRDLTREDLERLLS